MFLMTYYPYDPLGENQFSMLFDKARENGRMARLQYHTYLNAGKIYICKKCNVHLADNESLISRNFRANHGQGHMFDKVVNIRMSKPQERYMSTGTHVIRDVFCEHCDEKIGWRYDKTADDAQQYKEGKYILEVQRMSKVAQSG